MDSTGANYTTWAMFAIHGFRIFIIKVDEIGGKVHILKNLMEWTGPYKTMGTEEEAHTQR